MCSLRSITDEIPWSAECDYLGGVPNIPGPRPATVHVEVEGIVVTLDDWDLQCYADDITRVVWQQNLVVLCVADLGKPDVRLCLDCRDYYDAAVLSCLVAEYYGASLEQLPPYSPPESLL